VRLVRDVNSVCAKPGPFVQSRGELGLEGARHG
jgi:hypothetical protein